MKIKTFNQLTIAILLFMFTACKPEKQEFAYLQERSIGNLSGEWKGVSVLQRDRDAEAKKFPYQSMDITSFLNFKDFKIQLTQADGKPNTFTINNGQSLPLFKFTTGTWRVNNEKQVSEIQLINGADTAVLNISPMSNLKENQLMLQYTKRLINKPVITYEMTLTK